MNRGRKATGQEDPQTTGGLWTLMLQGMLMNALDCIFSECKVPRQHRDGSDTHCVELGV